ncbi:NTF2-like protein [Hortaea werneckii]|nr:NTF2-like protein [Hortaea werneckii]
MNGIKEAKEPVALPSAAAKVVSPTVVLQPPLSRRGHGPALLLVVPAELDLNPSPKTLDPPPLQKWAEEGFAVAQIQVADGTGSGLRDDLQKALDSLASLEHCENTDSVGLISYNVSAVQELREAVEGNERIKALISYGTQEIQTEKPQLRHVAGEKSPSSAKSKIFHYPDLGPFFAVPSSHNFKSAPAAVAHTRCLSFLKPILGGPYFDLEAIWEEHTLYEFGEREVEKTMGTMVQEPYVNHIPTMTGGIGRERLTNFYRYHFVFNNPQDTALELVSRTVGIDRVIDEFVFSFTHDMTIDWLLPGIPPTGKKVEIPFTSIVNVRGDRLFHEHIAWDQATVLRQLGLLPEYLPFPYALPDGRAPAPGKHFEYQVPTAGRETAQKLADESAVESNGLFSHAVSEVDDK